MSAELDLMGEDVAAIDDNSKKSKNENEAPSAPKEEEDVAVTALNEAADSTKKQSNKNPPSFAADFTPVPPETPDEKAMKEWGAIEITSREDRDSEMSKDERMLLEAQREAEEAEAMLREAELESARIEKELESLPSYVFERVEENVLSPPTEEEDALASMASAYQAALDAANDNVNLLSAQIEELEVELNSAIVDMEAASEDKERVSAEYAYLASNYREYKQKMDQEGEEMRADIQAYNSRVEFLENEIESLKQDLLKANEELTKWKSDYESVQKDMIEQMASSSKEQEDLKATLDDVTSTFESTLLDSQKEYEASLAVVTSEYDLALSDSKKMIAALRTSLRNTRSQVNNLSTSSEEDLVQAVDDVRVKMNDEVEKLKGVLKELEEQGVENDDIIKREREERENLMEEIE